ncbi:MAG TPA: methyl-accepting chemotaxis protein, partial [Desulfobacteraceae bacterium]|nr:methyl-accepting chemotaxis protein [Desulfobacteraceae bacterium]
MKKINDIKLSVKLIIGGVVSVFIPMLIVGIISVNEAGDALVDAGKRTAERVALDLAMTAEIFLEEEMKFAKEMSFTPVLKRAMEGVAADGLEGSMAAVTALDAFLAEAHQKVGADYDLFFTADAAGNTLGDSQNGGLRAKKINVADRDYFKAAATGKAIIGKPIKSRASGLPVVVMAVPLENGAGKFIGLFGAVLKLASLSDKLTAIEIGDTGYPFVADSKGIVIAHPKKEFIFELDMTKLDGLEDITRRMLAGEAGNESYTFKGVKKLAGFAPVPMAEWSICVTQNKDEFMAPVRKMEIYNLIVGGIVLAVVGVLIFFASLTIVRPINEAVAGLKDISEGEGDLTKRLKVRGKDEIGVLSHSFNVFIDRLQAMISDINGGVDTLSSSSTELAAISDQMSRGASQTSEKAGTVAASAEEMTTNMNSVSAAMEESSANVNTVAGAAEQMNATIDEIAKNAENARAISFNAVTKMEDSTDKMNELGDAAQAIGQVV